MIRYKQDILTLLKKHGYSQTKIQRNNLLSGQARAKLKAGDMVSIEAINRICVMCRCQPGDILEAVTTDDEKIKFF